MKSIISEHFDILVVGGIALTLILAYVILLAAFKVDNAPIMTLMVSTVGGAVGLATGRKRSETTASTERGDVVVTPKE